MAKEKEVATPAGQSVFLSVTFYEGNILPFLLRSSSHLCFSITVPFVSHLGLTTGVMQTLSAICELTLSPPNIGLLQISPRSSVVI
jgi:hypothetical protein